MSCEGSVVTLLTLVFPVTVPLSVFLPGKAYFIAVWLRPGEETHTFVIRDMANERKTLYLFEIIMLITG